MDNTELVIYLRQHDFELIYEKGNLAYIKVPSGVESFSIFMIQYSQMVKITEEEWNKI